MARNIPTIGAASWLRNESDSSLGAAERFAPVVSCCCFWMAFLAFYTGSQRTSNDCTSSPKELAKPSAYSGYAHRNRRLVA